MLKNTKTPLQMSNRSKIVPENILKTRAVQVQQIKYITMITSATATALSITSYHCKTFFAKKVAYA